MTRRPVDRPLRRRAWLLAVAFAAACGSEQPVESVAGRAGPDGLEAGRASAADEGPPKMVTIEHILIAFEGVPRVESFRSKEQAETLARSIYDRVLSGVDFDLLKREFSDDRNAATGEALGPYDIVNDGVRPIGRQIPRSNYFRNLADVAFSLEVGEVGLAEYDPKDCPQGWHVVKRIE